MLNANAYALQAEELIKREMMTMLHYDAVFSPTAEQLASKRQLMNQAQHLAYLEQHPYDSHSPEDIARAKEVLAKEMTVVKQGMGHGDLSLEAYTQVWQECLDQVRILFLLSTT